MSAIARGSGAVLALLLFTSVSGSWEYATAVTKCPIPQAPDACGPGWYNVNCYGMVYGPNYWLVPPCLPWNGYLPGKKGAELMAARDGTAPWGGAAHGGAMQAQGYGPGGHPNAPGYPGSYPGTPGAPGYPGGYPGIPGYPGTPGGPGGYPGTPGGYAHAPSTPGYPGTPGAPGTPYPPGYPNTPGVPYPPGAPYPPGTPHPPGNMPYPPTNLPIPGQPPPRPDHAKIGTYPTHPYVRGPRDFFMFNEYLEDMRGRDVRPSLYQQ
jgi:hypothetical protein